MKFFAALALSSGYLTSVLNSPSTVAPSVLTFATLPFWTCSTNPGAPVGLLYGIRTLGSRPGANSAMIT